MIAAVLFLLTACFVYQGARGSRPVELWYALATTLIIALTFVYPRARVLTIPFFFVLIIVLLFWSARRSAEREDT